MRTILVYRDTVGARSESFVQRQYNSFKILTPVFVGTKRGPLAPKDAIILAAPGVFGAARRFSFRQLARISPQLKRILSEQKPELIHAQFGLGGALALPIARQADLPLVVTFHGGDATKKKHFERSALLPTIFQRRHAELSETARAIFCVSHFVRDALIARGFPPEKLETHYLGIDIPANVKLLPTGRSKIVLFVGRLVEKKGVATLIEAVATARRSDSAIELMVVGEGPLRKQLEQHAKSAGVKAQFIGWLKAPEVAKMMRKAMLLAVPSQTAGSGDAEGLPTVIMEAMTLGLPVVATHHAGIPEIVSDQVSGLLVPEADPAALADALLSISRDPELAARLRGEAYADVRSRFDAKRQSALLEQRLLEIIGSR